MATLRKDGYLFKFDGRKLSEKEARNELNSTFNRSFIKDLKKMADLHPKGEWLDGFKTIPRKGGKAMEIGIKATGKKRKR